MSHKINIWFKADEYISISLPDGTDIWFDLEQDFYQIENKVTKHDIDDYWTEYDTELGRITNYQTYEED